LGIEIAWSPKACLVRLRYSDSSLKCIDTAVTNIDVTVWIISALLAIGVGWSRYAKWKTRDKLVRDLAAMDAERREKILSRLNPDLAMQAREDLMRRFNIS
jgi:hypothetical protein